MKVKEENAKTGLKLNVQKVKIMASSPIILWQINGETMETVTDFILGAPKSLQMVTAAMKSEDDCFLAGKQTSVLKSRERHHSAKKGPNSHGYGLPSGHVWL